MKADSRHVEDVDQGPQNGAAGMASALQRSPLAKWGIWGGMGVLALVGAGYVLMGDESGPRAKQAAIPNLPTGGKAGVVENTDPNYREKARELQNREADRAQQEGRMAFPSVGVAGEKPRDPPTKVETMVAVAPTTAAPAPPARPQLATQVDQGVAKMMYDYWVQVAGQRGLLVVGSPIERAQPVPAAMAPAVAGNGNGGISAAARRVAAGTRLPVVLQNNVNSRMPGAVVATVIGGEWEGALLTGRAAVEYDCLRVEFHSMTPRGSDRSYPLQAAAQTGDTGSGCLRTDVDYHRVESFVGTVLSIGLGAYAQGLARTGQTVSSSSGGTVVADNGFDRTRARDYAVAQTGAAGAGWLAAQGARPPTVSLDPGKAGMLVALLLSDAVFDPARENSGLAAPAPLQIPAQLQPAGIGAYDGTLPSPYPSHRPTGPAHSVYPAYGHGTFGSQPMATMPGGAVVYPGYAGSGRSTPHRAAWPAY